MKHILTLLVLVVVAGIPGYSGATVWTVPSPEAGSIEQALDGAVSGDVISIEPGTYYEHDLQLVGGVTLVGATGLATDVVVDAQQQGRVLIALNLMAGVGVQAVTLRGGRAVGPSEDGRGGLIVLSGTAMNLSDCILEGGEGIYGGAVHASHYSELRMEQCSLIGNTAVTSGGAILAMFTSEVVLDGCLLADNVAANSGGAACASFNSPCLMQHCTLVRNEAGFGSAVASWDRSDPSLLNTIVALNQGGAALMIDGTAVANALCSDIVLNEGGDWTGPLADLADSHDNISLDPLFCGAGDDIWTIAHSSPCADGACGLIGAREEGCNATALEDDDIPEALLKLSARPNPFNPQTHIDFSMTLPGDVSLVVYDLVGRKVKTLAAGRLSAGNHFAVWNGDDETGASVSSGVYLAVLNRGGERTSLRLALIK